VSLSLSEEADGTQHCSVTAAGCQCAIANCSSCEHTVPPVHSVQCGAGSQCRAVATDIATCAAPLRKQAAPSQ